MFISVFRGQGKIIIVSLILYLNMFTVSIRTVNYLMKNICSLVLQLKSRHSRLFCRSCRRHDPHRHAFSNWLIQ